jgi:anthranilate phosphoribosyltransferase
VLLNAAAAIVAHDGVSAGTLPEALRAGLAEAARAIDSGAARDVLERWVVAGQAARARAR